MECFGTTDFDNNSRLITLSAIIISGLYCVYIYIYICLLTPAYGYCHMTYNYVCKILKVCVQTDINKSKIVRWKKMSTNRADWEKSIKVARFPIGQ
jgi:hypothetical protein